MFQYLRQVQLEGLPLLRVNTVIIIVVIFIVIIIIAGRPGEPHIDNPADAEVTTKTTGIAVVHLLTIRIE